jgi:hypothetical protein
LGKRQPTSCSSLSFLPLNTVSSKYARRRPTKCFVIDEAASRTSAYNKENKGYHVLQEFPLLPIHNEVRRSRNDAGDVRAGHGMQGMKRDCVDEARI